MVFVLVRPGFRADRMYYLTGRWVGQRVGGVLVDVEQVGQAVLDRGGVGEHPAGTGAALAAVVVRHLTHHPRSIGTHNSHIA